MPRSARSHGNHRNDPGAAPKSAPRAPRAPGPGRERRGNVLARTEIDGYRSCPVRRPDQGEVSGNNDAPDREGGSVRRGARGGRRQSRERGGRVRRRSGEPRPRSSPRNPAGPRPDAELPGSLARNRLREPRAKPTRTWKEPTAYSPRATARSGEAPASAAIAVTAATAPAISPTGRTARRSVRPDHVLAMAGDRILQLLNRHRPALEREMTGSRVSRAEVAEHAARRHRRALPGNAGNEGGSDSPRAG